MISIRAQCKKLGITEIYLCCTKKAGEPWTSEDIWDLYTTLGKKEPLNETQERLLLFLQYDTLRLRVTKEQKKEKNFKETLRMLAQLKKANIIPGFKVVEWKP